MLKDTQVKNAKPAEKPYRLADGEGLNLFVTPAGAKVWRYRYRFEGKEKTLVIGSYPDISLADARQSREDARALLKEGKDPSAAKKLEKLIGTKRSTRPRRRLSAISCC